MLALEDSCQCSYTSVCQRAFSLLEIRFQRPWVRILHSSEEDNLSPFDSKIACLCRSIEINNKHIYVQFGRKVYKSSLPCLIICRIESIWYFTMAWCYHPFYFPPRLVYSRADHVYREYRTHRHMSVQLLFNTHLAFQPQPDSFHHGTGCYW